MLVRLRRAKKVEYVDQVAARERFMRRPKRKTGIKVTPEDVAAIIAGLEALR